VSTVLLEPIVKSWGNIRAAVLGVDGHIAQCPRSEPRSPPALPEIELELRVVVAVSFV
jgi:hypothetical protein